MNLYINNYNILCKFTIQIYSIKFLSQNDWENSITILE